MNGTLAIVPLAAVFALAACPQRDAAEAPPPSPAPPAAEPADPALAETAACTNPEVGYRVEYPAGWRTNPGDVMPECSLFDPEPIRIEAGTELPFDIAIAIRREEVAFERLIGDRPQEERLLREETRVDGRPAMRIDTRLTEPLLRPAGSRSYRYCVELDGATLIAETHNLGEPAFETKTGILDAMVESLRFLGES